MLDRINALEVMPLLIDQSCRQCRHRAATAEDRHPRLPGARIQHANAVDKGATVREVTVIDTRVDAALGYGIGLPLEWTAGMDHQVDRHRAQRRSELAAHRIAAPILTGTPCLRV